MNTMRLLMIAIIIMTSEMAFSQVSVTATGGTLSGSYTTLNAAFAAINAGTHQGTINILITGNTTEPSPPTPLVASGVGSTIYSNIYISPSGGSWTVSSSSLPFAYSGIIELFGAQHVVIDGDPLGTGTRNLTFKVAVSYQISTSAIRLGSTSTSGANGASYDTIRNCNIIGGSESVDSSAQNAGIIVSGNSTGSISNPVAYGCSYNAFINNTFSRCYYGIYLNGHDNTGQAANNYNLIRRNYFLGNTQDTSNSYCIYLNSFNNSVSTNIGIIDSNDFTATGTSFLYCIYNERSSGALTVCYNNIHDGNGPAVYGFTYGEGGINMYLNFYNNSLQNWTVTQVVQPFSAFLIGPPINGGASSTDGVWDIHNNLMTNISGGFITGMNFVTAPDSAYCHDNTFSNFTTTVGTIYGISMVNIIPMEVYHNVITGLTAPYGVTGIQATNIHDNIISGLSTASFSGPTSSIGIYVIEGSAYNNMISNIVSDPQSATGYNTSIGIQVQYSRIFANSIALNTANVGSFVNPISMSIYDMDGQSFYKDNIIYNTQNSSNAYGIYLAQNPSTDTLDYNEYYIPHGSIGYTSVTSATSLLDWQAATGGQDMHSLTGPVPFVSTSNLHIDSTNYNAANVFQNGTYITPWDIDGQVRSYSPCIGADEFYALNLPPDSIVWPGDANADHLVDNADLLPIGLGYDSTGPARVTQGIVWQGDLANNWNDSFTTYAPLVNFNHADCNGDGTINADDTLAIVTNFGDVHAKTNNYNGVWRSGIPGITIAITPDTVLNGQTLTANISLGDSATSVSNIYGLAFTYNYDPLVVDTNTVSFAFIPSWIGSSANSINIHKNFSSGQVKAAITGIDHLARSGSGQVATFIAVVTTGNINGKDLSYYTNLNYISDITAIDQFGDPVPLNAGIDSNQIGYTPNGIQEIKSLHNLSIYPNPASTQVRISADANITGITITDILGETVKAIEGINTTSKAIDISQLSAGIYIVQASSQSGSATAKLVVSR